MQPAVTQRTAPSSRSIRRLSAALWPLLSVILFVGIACGVGGDRPEALPELQQDPTVAALVRDESTDLGPVDDPDVPEAGPSDRSDEPDDGERVATEPTFAPVPLPTPNTSGEPVGAAVLRELRPIRTPTPLPVPTVSPTTAPAPLPSPTTATTAGAPDDAASEAPTAAAAVPTSTADSPDDEVPDGTSRLGALRTATGIMTAIVGGGPGDWQVISPCNNVVSVASGTVVATPLVLIDPGHGGTETGAVGPAGLIEKDANLDVSIELKQWLSTLGVSAELTRDRDYRLAIRARTAMANALQPTIFVSVHHNGGSTIEHTGAPVEVFFQEGSSESRRLAGIVHEELKLAMDPFASSWRGTPFQGAQPRFNTEGGTLYGILRRSTVPTVITEAFYIDNADGESLARDPAVVTAEAEALGAAIQRFLTTADPGSGFVDGQSFTLGSSSGGTDGCIDPPLE